MEARVDRAGWQAQLRGFNASVYDDAVSRGRVRASVFTCECGKPDCIEGVLLEPDEYEALRDRGGYILAAGHHVSRFEDTRRLARRLSADARALRAQAAQQQRRLRRFLGR